MFIASHFLLILFSVLLYWFVGGGPTVTSYVFDVYIVFLILYVLFFKRCVSYLALAKIYPFLFLVFVFAFIGTYNSLQEHFEPLAYLRGVRHFLYLAMFVFLGELARQIQFRLSLNDLKSFIRFYVAGFLVFYSVQITFGESRPRMYSENNYEVPSVLLMILIYVLSEKAKYRNYVETWGGLFVSVMSLSKSAILAASFMVYSTYSGRIGLPLKLISIVSLSVLVAVVFIARIGEEGMAEVDRFKFLLVLLDGVREFDWLEILFGKGISTPLDYRDCLQLKFWASAISQDYAYCDSTVYHSFIMKLVYDLGVIGCLFIMGSWYFYLRKYYGSLGLKLFIIVLLSSLSVSGFSNSIIIWPLFMGLLFTTIRVRKD